MLKLTELKLLFTVVFLMMAVTGCSDTGKEGLAALGNDLKIASENIAKIDPAALHRLLTEIEKLRKERDEAERRAKDIENLTGGKVPLAVVGKYTNSNGKPTKVEHIEGSRFTFTNGDGSKQELRYDVTRRAFIREEGSTAAFFFPETRTIAFDGVFWRP